MIADSKAIQLIVNRYPEILVASLTTFHPLFSPMSRTNPISVTPQQMSIKRRSSLNHATEDTPVVNVKVQSIFDMSDLPLNNVQRNAE